MMLDLSPEDTRSSVQRAGAAGQSVGPEPTFGESVETAFRGAWLFGNMFARSNARAEAWQKVAEDFQKVSGQSIISAYQPEPDREGKGYNTFGGRLRKAVDAWNTANPDKLFLVPAESDVERMGIEVSQGARRRELETQLRPGSFTSSLGGFIGGAGGSTLDLPNLMTLPYGVSGGLVKTFLAETALGAGASAVSEVAGYGYRREVDPAYGLSDAVTNIAVGGLGQGALATAAKAVPAGVKALAAQFNRVRAGADRTTADAGNVIMADALADATNPLRTGLEGQAAHHAALRQAVDDVYAGRRVEIPQEAFLESQARIDRVFDADNRSVGVRYEIAEASDLVTSHLDDFRENTAFPQELQPRDRSRALSQEQVTNIASNLVPERLGPSPDASTGAPIISADGIVESGNGRVMALRRAYDMDGPQAASYRNYLAAQGFDVAGFERPVLVARRFTALDPSERLAFVTAANRSSALRLSAAEQAVSDARLLDGEALGKWRVGDASAAENRDFVRDFARRLNRGEQATLFDKMGELSQEGSRRIQAALMARAYGDPSLLGRVLEDVDSNIKTIGGALSDAAGAMAQLKTAILRGEVAPGMDLTADLLDAVRLVMKARDVGRPLRELVAQGDLLFEASPLTQTLLRAMFRDGEFKAPIARSKIAALLNDYAVEAQKALDGPLLIGDPLQAGDVLATAARKLNRPELATLAEARLDPETVRAAASMPETNDAIAQEAYRLAAERPDLKIIVDGEERSLGDALMDLDDELKAANELEACATGRLIAAE